MLLVQLSQTGGALCGDFKKDFVDYMPVKRFVAGAEKGFMGGGAGREAV